MDEGTETLTPRRRVVVRRRSDVADPSSEEANSLEVERLKGDIAQRRAEMSVTVDQLRDRLRPERMKQRMTASAREATIGRAEDMIESTRRGARTAGADIMERIREHPIPAAMAAIGLGWLLTRPVDSERSQRFSEHWSRDLSGDADAYGDSYEDVAAEGAGQASAGVAGAARNAQARVSEAAGRVREGAGDVRDRLTDRGQEMRWQARSQASRARWSIERAVDDNPLALGVAALAAGAMLGLSTPLSEGENNLMGETRDRLMDRAQTGAEDAVHEARRVAGRAANTVKEEVRGQSG